MLLVLDPEQASKVVASATSTKNDMAQAIPAVVDTAEAINGTPLIPHIVDSLRPIEALTEKKRHRTK